MDANTMGALLENKWIQIFQVPHNFTAPVSANEQKLRLEANWVTWGQSTIKQ